MRLYELSCELEAPLAIKRNRQSDRSETAFSVAGTAVRGAFARLYLDQYGSPDATFETLFADHAGCRFGPLDPSTCVLPQTAVSCKRWGKFRADSGHGVADQLWTRIAENELGSPLPSVLWDKHSKCHCGADLKKLAGFYNSRDANGDLAYQTGSVTTSVAPHVGIDRVTGSASESIFYSIVAMAPENNEGKPTRLTGRLYAEERGGEQLRELLQAEDHTAYIGHARTRGYGRVRLDVFESEYLDPEAAAIRSWSNDAINWLRTAGVAANDGRLYFGLTFPNGAIFVDRWLRYTLDPADALGWLPRISDAFDPAPVSQRPPSAPSGGGELRFVTAVTSHELVRGWNAAHGLPRQDEWGIVRGAVYVYRFDGGDAERNALVEALCRLSEQPLGLRICEGFGTVLVSDPFHQTFFEQERER